MISAKSIAFLFLGIISSVIHAFAQQQGSIEITVSNIRNDNGWVLVSIFNQQEGFPSDSTKAYKTLKLEAKHPTISFNIKNLKPGEYAIALVHDENQNLVLDYNLVGAPVEGYAASGSNRRFSAPRFQSSKFRVRNEPVKMEIKMNYLF